MELLHSGKVRDVYAAPARSPGQSQFVRQTDCPRLGREYGLGQDRTWARDPGGGRRGNPAHYIDVYERITGKSW